MTTPSPVTAASAPDSALADVLRAERQRAAGLIAGDVAAVAPLLHDELVYVHAPGLRQRKAELLGALPRGPRFLVVDFAVEGHACSGDLCVLNGQLHLRLLRAAEDTPVEARSYALAVWQCGPEGWQLRCFQSTRRPD